MKEPGIFIGFNKRRKGCRWIETHQWISPFRQKILFQLWKISRIESYMNECQGMQEYVSVPYTRSALNSVKINRLEYFEQWIALMSHFLSFGIKAAHFAEYSSRILKTVPANRPFVSNSFFRPTTISKVAIIKAKSATIAFFSSISSFLPPRSFFFAFPLSLLVWFWSLLGPRNLPFYPFSLKWRQISLGWFPRNRLGIIKSEKQISQEEEMPFIYWNRIEIEWFIEYLTSGKDWIAKVYNV